MLLTSVLFLATAVEGFHSTPLDHGTGSAPSCFEAFSKVVTTCGLDMRMGMSLSISKAKGGMTMEPDDMMMTIPDSAAPDYCSGSCNAALTDVSEICDGNDAVEAPIKTMADGALQSCSPSPCAESYKTFFDDCQHIAHCTHVVQGDIGYPMMMGGLMRKLSEDNPGFQMPPFCNEDCLMAANNVLAECGSEEDDLYYKIYKKKADDFLKECRGPK